MDYVRRWRSLSLSLAALLGVAALLPAMAIAPVAAQDDRVPHPAHIHSGSCDNLGDIVVPLADVQENRAGERFGAQTAVAVEQSFTEAPMQLGEILAAPHAINIHLSADEIQNYIACGDIGGRVIDNRLAIGLRELNDSGFSGVAVLAGTDAGTDVTVYLASESGGEADTAADDAASDDAAAPAADADDATAAAEADTAAAETPAAAEDAPAAVEVAVDIRDFAYNPATVEIAVGDTVTWTNQDTVPHTATASDAAVLQSGTIAPGASFSQVFEAPGEIEYHCEFHPNMVGTIVVS